MESLAVIKAGKILYLEDALEIYGQNLMHRLSENHPQPMKGRISRSIACELSYSDTSFNIRESGPVKKFNPFSRKLVSVWQPSLQEFTSKPTVKVFEPSFRDDVESIVADLNEESGQRYVVKFVQS